MSKTVAVINSKGGVAKTTTASALVSGLKLRSFRTLAVDLDAQGNLGHIMSVSDDAPTIVDLFSGKSSAVKTIQSLEQGDIIASSPELATAEAFVTGMGREYKLKEILAPLASMYDAIILDLPPGLGIITVNALTAATDVIIPVQADALSLKALEQMYQIIKAIQENSNPSLCIRGILLTRYSPRSILSRDLANTFQQVAKNISTKVFTSTIREGIAIKEAQARQKDIFSYAPQANVTEDYVSFVDELIADLKI